MTEDHADALHVVVGSAYDANEIVDSVWEREEEAHARAAACNEQAEDFYGYSYGVVSAPFNRPGEHVL